MSRAFVKDDGPDEPPIVPPRPPLPAGVTNYVTPRGLKLLVDERNKLESKRASLSSKVDDTAKREITVVNQQLVEINKRIGSARVVKPSDDRPDTVRFGTTPSLRYADGTVRTLTIVGVDEADPARDRIPFTSPVARAITGKSIGSKVPIKTPSGEDLVIIESIKA